MFTGVSERTNQSTKINGSLQPGTEENFLFGQIARVVYPVKTDHQLARIGRASDRAAREWLAGRVAPPIEVITDMFVRIFARKS